MFGRKEKSVITENRTKLIPVVLKDEKNGVGITNYADTVVFDGNKTVVALRFGGYPETVLSMSDALFSGSKLSLQLPDEKSETVLTTYGGKYERRMKGTDTCAESVLKLSDTENSEEKKPRDIYIFCKDETGLFSELDSKLFVPLIPEWEEYFIRELKGRKILKKLNVYSSVTFAAYRITLKDGEKEIVKVFTDGLKSGEICIPGAKNNDTAFKEIYTFTQYLESFGKAVARKIQSTFIPVFNPANEDICEELKQVNEHIKANTGYSLYEAQLAGAEAIKRQLAKEKMTMLVSSCGTGKTKIGAAALYAYQKSKGGGARINVITCPSHVAKKWVRELYETVPDCVARTVSSITDIDRMYELYRHTDKSIFMVLSKESARNGYLRKPAVTWNERRKAFVCPICGAVQEMTVTNDGISYTLPVDSLYFREENAKNHKCSECGAVLWEADNPDCLDPAKNEWVRIGGYGYIHRKFAVSNLHLVKTPGKRKQVEAVIDDPDGIFPAAGAYKRYPLSRYIKHRFKKLDAYICDELHEYSGESAQGEAMAEIAGISKKVIAMTATLINGYAKGMFYLLFRLKPRLMLMDGFRYNDARKFCQRYGVVESIFETDKTKYNAASKNCTRKVREKFLPGISPIVYSKYLMENTVFLSLYDMAKELPDYEEIPVACKMSDSVKKEYEHMETEFKTVMRKDRRLANKILSVYLNLLTAYPDQPYGHEPVVMGDTAIVPRNYPDEPNGKLNKVLELVERKIKAGERVIIYTAWVRLDSQSVLEQKLAEMGINACILKQSVDPSRREDWVKKKLGKGMQVLITNPFLVETGLDLNEFTTLIFYNLAFNLYVLRQASCRSWRINQTAPKIEVYLFYYADTMQQRALRLMASKLAAATMIEGQLSDEGLAAISQNQDMTTQLARDLASGIKESVEDLTATFKKMAVKNERNAKTQTQPELKVVKPIQPQTDKTPEVQLTLFDLLAS